VNWWRFNCCVWI